MRKSSDSDLITEWQRLTIEWQATLAIYQQATKTSGGPGSDRGDQDTAVEKARERLNEIKRQIDAIVAAGGARRRNQMTQRDHIVVAMIEPSTEISESEVPPVRTRFREKATSGSK